MELEDLVGKHTLYGVDLFNKAVRGWCDVDEDAQHCLFKLGDQSYVVVEDPSDGYRSCMREIQRCFGDPTNLFPGEEVLARMDTHDDEWNQENDTLELVSVVTRKVVLRVGTDNCDDYYPYFVANFMPENMSINATVRAEQDSVADKQEE